MNENLDALLSDFYLKYNGESLSKEKLSVIKETYGDDVDLLLKDLYSKYAGESISEDKISTIKETYSVGTPTQLTPEMMETGQRDAAPAYAMTEEKYAAEKKSPSESPLQDGEFSYTGLSSKEESDFQDFINNDPDVVKWRDEFKEEWGEEPQIDGADYDYRGAWKAGIKPKPTYEPETKKTLHHWDSIGVDGKDLKSESHSTRWKSDYMKATGINPDEAGITKEQALSELGEYAEITPELVSGDEYEEYDIEKSTYAEMEKNRLEEEKIKRKKAMFAAVGREQGKIVASEIGSTDDAIMPNADVDISEKISKSVEKQQDKVLDSGAKMMYGWRGEDNYYANVYLNYLDELSPNEANDLRSEIDNNSKFFSKQRSDLRAPSSEVIMQGLNIAAGVANGNFNRAAAEAAPAVEALEGLQPRMQEHLDRIDGQSYDGTEDQYNEYVALVKEASSLLSSPQVKRMQERQVELERVNKDYKNSPDVNIIDYYEEAIKNNQRATDNAYRENNAVLDVAIPLYDAGTKAIVSTVKSMADFANNINADNKWGTTDDIADAAKRLADTYEVNNPTPSKFAREMFEKVVVVDGYEIVVDNNGPTGQVFAPNGYVATEKDSNRILKEYSSNSDMYDTEENFNFRAGLYTGTTVGADMLLGLIPIGGGVSKGVKLLGMGAKASGVVGMSTAIIVQSQNDFRQAAKEAGATDQEAAALGFAQASVISLVALINPIEAKALMTITGSARKRMISQYVQELASGATKKSVVEKFAKEAIARAIVKKGKAVGWEMIKEGAEETLEIPANAIVAKTWDYLGGVNTQTETDVHDVLNTFGTAALGALPFAFIGGGGSSRTRQELMYAATTDIEATRQLLRKSIGKEITTESGGKIIINDEYINKHIAQLEELKNVSSVYFTNKNITEEDKIAVTSLIAKKKGLEELSKIGGEAVKNSKKAEMEAIDAALGLYMDKKKGDAFYVLQGVAVTKEELEGKMNDPEWVKGFKAGRWNLKVSNDKEVENKLYAIYKSKENAVQEQGPEGVDVDLTAPTYEAPTQVTSPIAEEFATVNRNDGKGTVSLTEDEYNAEMEKFAPVEPVAKAETTETQKEQVDAIQEPSAKKVDEPPTGTPTEPIQTRTDKKGRKIVVRSESSTSKQGTKTTKYTSYRIEEGKEKQLSRGGAKTTVGNLRSKVEEGSIDALEGLDDSVEVIVFEERSTDKANAATVKIEGVGEIEIITNGPLINKKQSESRTEQPFLESLGGTPVAEKPKKERTQKEKEFDSFKRLLMIWDMGLMR
jgi:hypothetical protein